MLAAFSRCLFNRRTEDILSDPALAAAAVLGGGVYTWWEG
jgi:hypothetical protein